MPASEIDDIFSGLVKKTSGVSQAGPSSSKSALNCRPQINDQSSSSKKKKAKKRKRETDATDGIEPTEEASGSVKPPSTDEVAESKSRSKKLKRVVETVVDPSVVVESSKGSSLPRKVEVKTKSNPKVKKAGKDDKDHLERFKDSRGTGPSKLVFKFYPSYVWYLMTIVLQDVKQRKGSWYIRRMSWVFGMKAEVSHSNCDLLVHETETFAP